MTYDIASIINHLYKNPTDKDFQEFAKTVSNIVDRIPSWKYKYMKGCYYGYKNISVSKPLARALQILANRLDGQSPLQSRVIGEITVLSINGLEPGSIVLGNTIRCAYCQVKFVPRSVTQPDKNRYCCKEHSRLFYNEKRRNKKWKI